MRLVRKPQAWRDIVEIGEYLGEADLTAADRFLDALERTAQTLLRSPRIGNLRISEQFGVIRLHPITGFENYLIFYKETADELTLIRIIHTARDYTRFL